MFNSPQSNIFENQDTLHVMKYPWSLKFQLIVLYQPLIIFW